MIFDKSFSQMSFLFKTTTKKQFCHVKRGEDSDDTDFLFEIPTKSHIWSRDETSFTDFSLLNGFYPVSFMYTHWKNFTPEQQETLYLTLSNYLESGSILNEVQFIDGPSDRIVLREFIKTDNPAEMAYTVKIPDIEQLI